MATKTLDKTIHIRDDIFIDITLCGLSAANVELESRLNRATCRNCYRKAASDLREIEIAREAGEDV